MNTYNNIYPFCDSRILNLPEIQRTIEKQKGKGLLMAILLFNLLKKCRNAIGKFDQIVETAVKVGVKTHTLKDMIKQCDAFNYDEERGIFWSPRQRRWLKISEDPSDEEKDDIVENGNVFIGIKKNKGKKMRDSKIKSKTSSSHLQDENMQSSDVQEQTSSLSISRSRSISIKTRNIEIQTNKAEEKQVSLCDDDGDDETKYKEILDSKSWCRSVKKRRGVDLEDRNTLSLFAKWMHDYCVSEQKQLKSRSDLRNYANNLLRQGSKTRDEWDRFFKSRQTEDCDRATEAEEMKTSPYERVFKHSRYSYSGYLLPFNAPLQTSVDTEYSYIQEKWIARKDFHKAEELSMLEHKKTMNSGYVQRTGGASC